MVENKKSNKGHAAGGFLAGILGSNILRNIASTVFGEVASKASEEFAMKIRKGGKGFNDEALYNMVALTELKPIQYKKLEEFTLQLYKDDKKDHTENLVKFILFIATGAQEFEETKEDKPGAGKDDKTDQGKNAKTKKSRHTKTGGDFLKKLIAKETHEERLDMCRATHVFDVPTEGYLRVAKKIAITIKEHYGESSTKRISVSETWLTRAKQKFEDSKK